LVGESKHTEALFLIEQFYNKQQCKKSKKKEKEIPEDSEISEFSEMSDIIVDGPCGNEGWCTKCSTLSLKENQVLIKSLDQIMLDNFKYI